MKPLMTCIFWALLMLMAGCDGGADDTADTPADGQADSPTSTDATAPVDDTASVDDTADSAASADANDFDFNQTYNPMLYLVQLTAAIDRRAETVPPNYTGWVKEFRGDGAFALEKMVEGVEHGPGMNFYGPTKPMAAYYSIDGKIHGVYRFWNRDGKQTESRYEHGERVAQ